MLRFLGAGVPVADLPPSDEDWYANVLWIDRRECVLVTHVDTLFSVFVADVRAADPRPAGPYFVAIVEAERRAQELLRDSFSPLDPDNVQVARSPGIQPTARFLNR